ncbi:MAG: 4a-hydroxytetrahydrobiopterin dehydratase [Victivallales bacterium]|jgi:4a-hydroxytetrahydrobiopterin dehydratase
MNEKPLVESKCVPCQGGVEALKGESICLYAKQISKDWKVINEHHLEREFKFKNFADALGFVNKVGQLAEAEGHHPDIWLSWGKVQVILYTHKINGLHGNDFILAAKIDQL